jgi:hypothetical protein
MSKTVRVSDEFHEYVEAHRREDETLRRLSRGPDPGFVAGFLTDEEAAEAKAAVEDLRDRDDDRFDRARDALSDG